MSSPISDHNPETATLYATAEREYLNYISKFRLPANITQYIDLRLIFHDVHINNPIITSDVKLNSWALNYLRSYQLSLSSVVDLMLKVFCEEFHQ